MDTYEPTALYDEVVRLALGSTIFSSRDEVVDTINSLIKRGILKEKIGTLNQRETEVLVGFGAEKSISNGQSLKFSSKSLEERIKNSRLELYEEFFYPH